MIELIAFFGGPLLDAVLKALNIKVNRTKIDWGFSYQKNPFLAAVAFGLFSVLPLSLYNNLGYEPILVALIFFCICVFLMIISYADYEEIKKESDILDDDFKSRR